MINNNDSNNESGNNLIFNLVFKMTYKLSPLSISKDIYCEVVTFIGK